MISISIPIAIYLSDKNLKPLLIFLSPAVLIGIVLMTDGTNLLTPSHYTKKQAKDLTRIEKICKRLIQVEKRWDTFLSLLPWLIMAPFLCGCI